MNLVQTAISALISFLLEPPDAHFHPWCNGNAHRPFLLFCLPSWTHSTLMKLAIACLVTSASTAIFVYAMRHGHLTTSDAAPHAIERCRVVVGDSELLSDICPICMEEFDEDKEIRVTPCKHTFHGPCLRGWLNVSRVCPMCRHDLMSPVSRAITTSTATTNMERGTAAVTTTATAPSAAATTAVAARHLPFPTGGRPGGAHRSAEDYDATSLP